MKSLFNSKTLTPNSQKSKPPKVPKENLDPNSVPSDSSPYKSPGFSKLFSGKSRSPLPPRPPLKRKLSSEILEGAATIPTASDSGVQVIVRIRPPSKDEEEEGSVVQKLSGNSVSISDHTFTFDSVADTVSTQEDVFHLVGLPLVENCLAGFNSSIFAYGQTGSGKTYTMWGPPTALLDENSLSNERGLTPRVFERLFSRINEEQIKHSKKELTYHCTCSFLEIYNEQITDLLDPTQRNLQIREDVGTGVYVDSLTEEFVYTLKDVNQLLMKGLANRRTGATSVNLESSRSHCVFTCVIRSQFKNVEDGLNAARMSRINLVDLAGSERQKLTKAAGDRLKEAGNINKSLSQLGNLINILGEVSQSGKQRHIPYRDSKLTFLLQESLGGNAKLAMICAVSPSVRCKSESLSTLRFAQRAKAIKNKAVVNETTQDDVNMLREQVRLLRDELVRIKSNRGATMGDGYSTAEHARRTVNLLRMSLTCTTAMPSIKDDSDEEMEIDENDVERPPNTSQESLHSASTGEPTGPVHSSGSMERKSSSPESATPGKLSIVPVICEPSLLESQSRKSPKTSTSISPSHRVVEESSEAATSALDISLARNRKAESLAASIHRGLQVLDNSPKKSNKALRRASFSFFVRPISPEPPSCLESVPVPAPLQGKPACKVDACTQTIPEELEEMMKDDSSVNASGDDVLATSHDPSLELVPVDAPLPAEKSKKQKVPKAVKKLLAGSIRREMELEALNARQAAEIQQLNRLVQHYKHERECNAVIAQTREDKISRLETLMDGILPTEEFMEEEFLALQNEHKHLQSVYENHPEVLRINIELKRAQEELDKYHNFYELGEREVLMEEIQDLKTQLNYYLTSPSASLRFTSPIPLPLGLLSTIPEQEEQENGTKRESWSEAEGKWITLTKELEIELDSNRNKTEKLRVELDSERRCTEELKEALQMAVQGHARILEQYADLQEKHMALLAKNRKISDGIEDVKKAAAKAGVGRAESKFINSLAAEISVLRVDREKERRYWRDENKGLQAQLRDMAEAVQAAGELVVRLKEAEEMAKRAQKRARVAEQETEKAYQEMENLKRNYDKLLTESRIQKEVLDNTPDNEAITAADVVAKYDASDSLSDQRWREEFEPFGINGSGEVSKGTDPNSWFLGYDRCNI
ncbi:hypothetical protein LUZ63_005474 [Rhynchospora breviuscula]|uniref:Kinesin motor domain-containing protein n=1 Tax=Rhynchospora breviuscula TaxID=2022672 RepID=A0A9Q0CMY4_9POAL|nr:hypothetical protein LUZ63_005474 [Rhynchospora breviuscula]